MCIMYIDFKKAKDLELVCNAKLRRPLYINADKLQGIGTTAKLYTLPCIYQTHSKLPLYTCFASQGRVFYPAHYSLQLFEQEN